MTQDPTITFDELREVEPGLEITDGDTVLTVVDVDEAHSVTDHTVSYDNGVTQTIEELHTAINKHESVWPVED